MAQGSIDTFIKLDTIKGESADAKHKDEIEVSSWSWRVSNSGSMSSGGGGGDGVASLDDFQFTHFVDASSTALMAACASGTHIKEGTITARKAGKDQQEYLIFKLNDIIITSVSPAGTSDGGTQESVTFQASKHIVSYAPQKNDGTLGAATFFKADVKAKTFTA
jgi:type VI secretion system secreted protein Hcp